MPFDALRLSKGEKGEKGEKTTKVEKESFVTTIEQSNIKTTEQG
jgi:hypothetical protein